MDFFTNIIQTITNGIDIFQKLFIENRNTFIYPNNMLFDHYLLLLFSFLPLFNKLNFWLYVIQLKEYRWDRFKEYISTNQGNSALINMWSILEFIILLFSVYLYFDPIFEILVYPVVYYFLIIQSIFVLRKLIKHKILKPKYTSRILMIKSIFIFTYLLGLFCIVYFNKANYIYSYTLITYIILPFILFVFNTLTIPIVNKKKNNIINKAIELSNTYNNSIKVGITGSYGKSSVKEYLSSILEQDGTTLKTPENVNTEMGVAELIIKNLNNTYKYFIAEMGAYRIGEIDLLGKIVNHKYGFLTAIGNQHLGLFGSIDNIKKGKSEIINSVIKNKGTLYINWNNEGIRDIIFGNKLNIIKYGSYNGSDTNFEILSVKEGITKFNFEYKGVKSIFYVPLIGEHNIINISGVLAFCYDMSFKTSDLIKYLKNIKSPNNTLSIVKHNNLTLIDDTYNLSEDGLFAGLEALSSFDGIKILLLDDILELGANASKIHYEIGEKIAKGKYVDKIMYVGVNYKSDIIKGLIKGGFDKNNLLNKLSSELNDEIILFEGRNAGKYIDKLLLFKK
ncbi:MAG: Mur ligase family protein [Candidatus Gracilibacteria bacterium]|nr:Mur ligase family protein [Candidatus Gracilibacteria bacterium]